MILLYFGDKYSAQHTSASHAVRFTGVVSFFYLKVAIKSGTANTNKNDRRYKARDVPEIFWFYLILVNRIKREEKSASESRAETLSFFQLARSIFL
jgi:hypothetical protein